MSFDHTELLLRLSPAGLEDFSTGTTVRADLEVMGEALDDSWDQRDELVDELLPDRAGDLLADWERVFAVYRIAGRTINERQARLVALLRQIPDLSVSTVDNVIDEYTGVDGTITEPYAFRFDHAGSVFDDPDDVFDGAFTFIVDMARADAVAASLDRDEVDELIDRVKPAGTTGVLRFDDFCFDDAYSLFDRDLLGA